MLCVALLFVSFCIIIADEQVAKKRKTDGNITGNVKADPNTDIRNNVTLPSGSRLPTGEPLRMSKYRCPHSASFYLLLPVYWLCIQVV
jgi:hypothetical protein